MMRNGGEGLPTLAEALMATCEALASIKGAPVHEARWLLQHITHLNGVTLIRESTKRALSVEEHLLWREMLKRRVNGEPLAYLLGYATFLGEDFIVNPHVLIPRPDTETLVRWVVEASIDILKNTSTINMMELGVGSGAPLIMVGKTLTQNRVIDAVTLMGCDISPEALSVAQDNLALHHVSATLMQSDWFAHFSPTLSQKSLHVIYSNPPYIAEHDEALLSDGVVAEPRLALTAKDSEFGAGMAVLAHIICHAPAWLTAGGALGLEHGAEQGDACRALMRNQGFERIETLMDDGGRERVTAGWLPHAQVFKCRALPKIANCDVVARI